MMTNQFGFDRDGFRVFVLSPAPRRDILLGKNLAFAPMAMAIAAVILVVVEFLCPMRLGPFSVDAAPVSFDVPGVLYLDEPGIDLWRRRMLRRIAPTGKSEVNLDPLANGRDRYHVSPDPGCDPHAAGRRIPAQVFRLGRRVPIYLLLSVVECADCVHVLFALTWQGDLLQGREQTILECVTNRAA